MTQPAQASHPYVPASVRASADSHNFRQRATPQGDLLDYIIALEKRVARLEAQINTH